VPALQLSIGTKKQFPTKSKAEEAAVAPSSQESGSPIVIDFQMI
jgi:hypothetical protein